MFITLTHWQSYTSKVSKDSLREKKDSEEEKKELWFFFGGFFIYNFLQVSGGVDLTIRERILKGEKGWFFL